MSCCLPGTSYVLATGSVNRSSPHPRDASPLPSLEKKSSSEKMKRFARVPQLVMSRTQTQTSSLGLGGVGGVTAGRRPGPSTLDVSDEVCAPHSVTKPLQGPGPQVVLTGEVCSSRRKFFWRAHRIQGCMLFTPG